MKPETKKSLFFLFLTITYLLQAINDAYDFSFVYFFGFMFAAALLYVIRNKYLGFLIGAAILAAMEFYDTNYKYLTVIAFLFICAHKSLVYDAESDGKGKKDSDVFSFLAVQLSAFAAIALLVYSLTLVDRNKINNAETSYIRTLLIFFWLIGIFAYSLFCTRNNKKGAQSINKEVSGSLRFMYLVSIFAFSATVLYTYAKIGHIYITYKSVFFPWFIYICSMVYNGDPYIKALAESIGNLLTKISCKDKVKE